MDAKDLELPDPIASPFDVEAHRGGRAYRPENTLARSPTASPATSTRSSSTPA